MNFKQIAEQNRKLLIGSSSLINEVAPPPRFKPRPIRNPIRYLDNPNGPHLPQIPIPNKFYEQFVDRPQWREFFKRYLGLDAWQVEEVPNWTPGRTLYRSDIRNTFELSNPAHRAAINSINAELPGGIKVVNVVVYHNGYTLVLGENGTIYWLGIDGHGNLGLFPTELGLFPGEFNPNMFPEVFKPGKDWIYHNPGRPSTVTPGSSNPMDPTNVNPPGPIGPSPGLLAPLVIPFLPDDASADPYGTFPGNVQPPNAPLPQLPPQLPPNLLPINPYDPQLNPGLFGG